MIVNLLLLDIGLSSFWEHMNWMFTLFIYWIIVTGVLQVYFSYGDETPEGSLMGLLYNL